MVDQQSEDHALIVALMAGDNKSAEVFYNRYAGKMLVVCMRYADSRMEAEDILQESFIKIFSKMNTFRGDGSLEGWIKRIVINTAIKQYHKKNYLQPITDDIQNESYETDPEENKMDFSLEELLEMIQNLSPRYRIVFSMYAIDGHSHKEIAEMLKISEGTSKSQLSRARFVLQKMILSKKNLNTYTDVGSGKK